MKRLIILALLLISTCTFAQRVVFGIKAGANISNFTGGDFEDVKKKALVGFHGGAFLNFGLGAFAIQPEAMVSTQGARIDSVSGHYDWKVTYITVPVVAQYRFGGGLYVEAGPQFGFKISEDIESKTIEEFANDLDLSAVLGLGFKAKSGFGLGARYTVGISKVGEFDASSGIDPDFKNGVAQISLYIPLTGHK